MDFINVLSLPKIRDAHVCATEQYQHNYPKNNSFIEIAYVTEGEFSLTIQGNTYTAKEKDIFCLFFSDEVNVSASSYHTHHTVSAWTRWRVAVNPLDALCLPVIIPACHVSDDIYFLIDKFIYEQGYFRSQNVHFAAKFLDLLYKVDRCARKAHITALPKEVLYAEQAKKYIQQHIFSEITQKSVAMHLGITSGYLCSIFKKVEGISLIKYVHQIKLDSIKALMEKENMYLYEAAAIYGYTDPNYVSKLFKQTFGYNITNKEHKR